MSNEFWRSANQSTGGVLTPELFDEALEAMRKQLEEAPRQRCPHLHPASYVRKLREQGHETARCQWCGMECRL